MHSLSLISRHLLGVYSLEEAGFLCYLGPDGTPMGITIPKDIKSNLSIASWKFNNEWIGKDSSLVYRFDQSEQNISNEIGNLSNQVISGAASRFLTKMKNENNKKFKDLEFYLGCIEYSSNFVFRQSVLKFIHSLFDSIEILSEINVLNKEKASLKKINKISDEKKRKHEKKVNETQKTVLKVMNKVLGF